MGQVLQGRATTTHPIQPALQRSEAPPEELAARHGLNAKTVANWRKPAFVDDSAMRPKALRSTVLTLASAHLEATISFLSAGP